jgi:hypothetical protein
LPSNLTDAEIEAELRQDYPFEDQTFTSGARGGVAGLSEPEADLATQEVQVELEIDFEANPDFARIIATEAPVTPHLSKDEILPDSGDEARGLVTSAKASIAVAKIFYRIVKRLIQKRDHGLQSDSRRGAAAFTVCRCRWRLALGRNEAQRETYVAVQLRSRRRRNARGQVRPRGAANVSGRAGRRLPPTPAA